MITSWSEVRTTEDQLKEDWTKNKWIRKWRKKNYRSLFIKWMGYMPESMRRWATQYGMCECECDCTLYTVCGLWIIYMKCILHLVDFRHRLFGLRHYTRIGNDVKVLYAHCTYIANLQCALLAPLSNQFIGNCARLRIKIVSIEEMREKRKKEKWIFKQTTYKLQILNFF